MVEQSLDDIRIAHTTRFVVRLADGAELHGIEFPSGRVICDDPIEGIRMAATVDYLTEPLAIERVERIPEGFEHVLGDDGRTCAAVARAQAAEDLRFDAASREAEGLPEAARYWRAAADFLVPPEADGA